MASPELATKHQFDSGALPLQHLTAQMEYQCLDLGEANDAVVGVRKIASRILRYRVFIKKCYQIKIALFPRYSFRIFLLPELQDG